MTVDNNNVTQNKWPRHRLVIRSIISATMPIGWTWAAMTALLPYYWLERGGGATLLGMTRASWLSLHVWSSIAMLVLTMAHVLLNRRGVARSFRVVGGAPNRAGTSRRGEHGLAWVGAALLLMASIGGGYWFAGINDSHRPGGDQRVAADAEVVISGQGHGPRR
ncbi:MAG: hypothetical protein WBV06_16755 [Acidimicrobiia bacterium]